MKRLFILFIVVFPCCFNFYFSDDIWCWASVYLLICPLYSSLVRCLLRSLTHFLIGLFVSLLLGFKIFLYILWDSFIRCAFCKYFLLVCDLSFGLVYGFLCCAKAFKFHWVPLYIFVFISLGGGTKKRSCCDLSQRVFFLCFPLRVL